MSITPVHTSLQDTPCFIHDMPPLTDELLEKAKLTGRQKQIAAIYKSAVQQFNALEPAQSLKAIITPQMDTEGNPLPDDADFPLIASLFVNGSKPGKFRLYVSSGIEIDAMEFNRKSLGCALYINKNMIAEGKQKDPKTAFCIITKLDPNRPLYSRAETRAKGEIEALTRLRKKPGICKILNWIVTGPGPIATDNPGNAEKVYFCYEKHYDEDLLDWGNRTSSKHANTPLKQVFQTVRPFILQIHNALNSLKESSYIHNDIKSDNFLVDSLKGTLGLCDFETALLKGNESTASKYSCEYLAPENWEDLLLRKPIKYKNEKTEIWAAGVVIYGLMFGTAPAWAILIKKAIQLDDLLQNLQQLLYQISIIRGEKPIPRKNFLPPNQPNHWIVQNAVQVFSEYPAELICSLPPHLSAPHANEVRAYEAKIVHAIEQIEQLVNPICDRLLFLLKNGCTFGNKYSEDYTRSLMLEAQLTSSYNVFVNQIKDLSEHLANIPQEQEPLLKMVQDMLKINPEDRRIPEIPNIS